MIILNINIQLLLHISLIFIIIMLIILYAWIRVFQLGSIDGVHSRYLILGLWLFNLYILGCWFCCLYLLLKDSGLLCNQKIIIMVMIVTSVITFLHIINKIIIITNMGIFLYRYMLLFLDGLLVHFDYICLVSIMRVCLCLKVYHIYMA